MAELVQYECSRCGSRLQVLGQAQVWCRCGSPMQPVARDLNPMGMAQPARARQVVLCLDADAVGQREWQRLALEGYTRGHGVSFADAATYGGCKDANEAWAKLGRLELAPGDLEPEPFAARGVGWKLSFSNTVGEYVVFANDEAAAARAPAGYVIYTGEELRALGGGGLNAEGLKQVHEAKKLFGGRVGLKQEE